MHSFCRPRLDFRHYGHAVKLDGEAVFRSTAYQEGRERAEFLWRRVGYGAHESRRAPISGPGSAQSEMAEVEPREHIVSSLLRALILTAILAMSLPFRCKNLTTPVQTP